MKQFLFLLITVFTIATTTFSQQRDYELTHEMSAEEAKYKHLIGKSFYPTPPPTGPVRMVAEFERMQAVLVRYQFGIPISLIADMSQECTVLTVVANSSQQNTVTNQYQGSGVNMSNVEFLLAPTDSYWTRDYGPWFVVNGSYEVGVCNFPYNRPRPNDDDIPIEVANYYGIELYGMDLIQTGGNWMCDGYGIASSTDLVIEENPSLTIPDIEDFVSDYLGVHTYNMMLDPLGEYIKHIDCWAKYLDVDKILIGQVPVSDPRYSNFEYVADYYANQISSYGTPYQVYRVFTPGGNPATPYTNSLILNDRVFVPQTGNTNDAAALEVYEEAMPGYEIIGVNYYGWENTDALHCRAKGIADLGMLRIEHIPLAGNVQQEDQFDLNAKIIPYSGAALYPDSLLIYYMVDGGTYTTSTLTQVIGPNYTGSIPSQPVGSEVSYYIHAADESGRSEDHPFIGAGDPHVFNVINTIFDVTVYPDTLLFEDFQSCIDGIPAIVKNNTDSTVTINNINNEGYDTFFWEIFPYNVTMPYDLAAGDSLVLNVIIGIPTTDLISYLQDTLFIETDASIHDVLIMVDSTLIVGQEELAVIETADMQVYPNPVNSNSRIVLSIPEKTNVNVSVYDIQGRVAGQVFSGELPEGDHNLPLNSIKDIDAGIYFIRMIAGDEVVTRKILLLE